jgi:hypothetical protein
MIPEYMKQTKQYAEYEQELESFRKTLRGICRVIEWELFDGEWLSLGYGIITGPHDGEYRYSRSARKVCVNRRFLKAEVDDPELINVIFHELVHGYIWAHDGDMGEGSYHNTAFRDAAIAHGAACSYRDDIHGWIDTELLPQSMEKVQGKVRGI